LATIQLRGVLKARRRCRGARATVPGIVSALQADFRRGRFYMWSVRAVPKGVVSRGGSPRKFSASNPTAIPLLLESQRSGGEAIGPSMPNAMLCRHFARRQRSTGIREREPNPSSFSNRRQSTSGICFVPTGHCMWLRATRAGLPSGRWQKRMLINSDEANFGCWHSIARKTVAGTEPAAACCESPASAARSAERQGIRNRGGVGFVML